VKKLNLIGVILLILIAGYFREHVFANINTLLYNKKYDSQYPVSKLIALLENFDYLFIYYLKWMLTPAFILLLGNINEGYTFSRLFAGIVQSPLPILVLLPVCYLYKKNIS